MKLTEHRRLVLAIMAEKPDALVYEKGAGWYCGDSQLDGRTAWWLLRAGLVTTERGISDDPWYLKLTEAGLAALDAPTAEPSTTRTEEGNQR